MNYFLRLQRESNCCTCDDQWLQHKEHGPLVDNRWYVIGFFYYLEI